jgi:glycogen debranching enzyme
MNIRNFLVNKKSAFTFALGFLILLLSNHSSNAQALPQKFALKKSGLELERPIRIGAFYDVAASRSAVFGHESGSLEAWVYPLKILDEFELSFQIDGFPATFKALDNPVSINVRPEATILTYAFPAFIVKQIIFAPVDDPGIVMLLDIKSKQPLTVTASFKPKLKLIWPAGLSGGYVYYDAQEHLYYLTEDSERYVGIVGSPQGSDASVGDFKEPPRVTSNQMSIHVSAEQSKSSYIPIVIAGSTQGMGPAKAAYDKLINSVETLYEKNVAYYARLQEETVSVTTPDERLNKAFAWAKVGMNKGLVTSPTGTGLVAGYSASGDTERPGFAWYFGRDSLWTTFALNSSGDFKSARTALALLKQLQRADGKIPHETPQIASLVNWFTAYPYAWRSADATPLYVIASADYWRTSGDTKFLRENWESILKAYRFSAATDTDANGLIENTTFGHGWVEEGKLSRQHEEIYLQGIWVEASRRMVELAEEIGDSSIATTARANAERARAAMEQIYWLPQREFYGFATRPSPEATGVTTAPAVVQSKKAPTAESGTTRLVEEDTVFPAVPLWSHSLEESRAQKQLDHLGISRLATDWGARGISDASPLYNPYAYHSGAVWPLFTGWVSVGAYAYGRPHIGFQALMSNALLTETNTLGYVTEVLSGDYNVAFPGSAHHQIWSEAMIVTPTLRGLFGIEASAGGRELRIAPQLPAQWNEAAVRNIPAGSARYDFSFQRSAGQIKIVLAKRVLKDAVLAAATKLTLAPAFPLDARIHNVTVNGRQTKFEIKRAGDVQSAEVKIDAVQPSLEVVFKYDEGTDVSIDIETLKPGSEGTGLRIISARSDADALHLVLEGRGESSYTLNLRTPRIVSEVGDVKLDAHKRLIVTFKGPPESYQRRELTIPLSRRK